ncbi:MAG: pyruvate kinase [Chloroherpetonaceae bacterium]
MTASDYLDASLLRTPKEVLNAVLQLRRDVEKEANETFAAWQKCIVRKEFEYSAKNFACYLALRRRDLRHLQSALLALGLSSLGRSEARVLANLDAVIASLQAICGEKKRRAHPSIEELFRGENLLKQNAELVLGKAPDRRSVRMMITLPTRAANDYVFVSTLLERGMNCARINCAHDTPDDWEKMIHHIRRAEKSTGLSCKVFMDLAGPKVRTSTVQKPHLKSKKGDLIFLYAARPSNKFKHLQQVKCALPEILPQVSQGDEVWIDDGHIGTVVEECLNNGVLLRVTTVGAKGKVIKPDRGLNFPTTSLVINPLTDKDLCDLDFICEFADGVNYSFVQDGNNVKQLQAELAKRTAHRKTPIALIAKIETRRAVEHFPEIVVQGAGKNPFGVMIARGDLAVEIGYQRIAEIQEELLWLSEAAHVPVIWATQVLESLVKKGIPSRAEITDAAMAERAECVMLNKGEFILSAMEILDHVLMRMEQHQRKKTPQLRALYSWQ